VQGRGPLISGLQMLPQIVPQILFAMVGGILGRCPLHLHSQALSAESLMHLPSRVFQLT
jgi:hypothetical protein